LVPSRERLEFEGYVISSLFAQTESALERRWRSRHENGYHKAANGRSRRNAFPWGRWFEPLEAGVRTRIRDFIEKLLEAELDTAPGHDRLWPVRISRQYRTKPLRSMLFGEAARRRHKRFIWWD
jgi:hypothetical protein